MSRAIRILREADLTITGEDIRIEHDAILEQDD